MQTRNDQDRPRWRKPQLKRLGKLRDIAGPSGLGAQSPAQQRS